MSNIVKKKLEISGMHCSSCAMNIDFDLEDVEGVKSVTTNYAKEVCEIEFDEDKIHLNDIIKVIDKTGYKALPFSKVA